ncbi:MAG: hypothetical protein AB3N14_13230 [Flavobacteriaceae bacterium]
MKKNKKTYLLFALVVAIWGVLGFKIVKSINPHDQPVEAQPKLVNFSPEVIKERDTFSILANYRDPFLGTLPKKKRITERNAVTPKPQLPKKEIGYSGFVTERGSGNKIFFVSIEGNQHMMTLKEVVEEVKLIAGDAEKIKVRYGGKTQTISLSQ